MREADRPYRVGDTVRAITPDPRWFGHVGTVTSADYDRSVPFVVELPDAPDSVPGIGICFTTKSLELVEEIDPKLERLEICRKALSKATCSYVSPRAAQDFLESEWFLSEIKA